MSTATSTPTTPTAPGSTSPGAPSRAASRPWALVAAREIQVKLRDRNFLMSTALTLLLLLGVLVAQSFTGGGGAMSYSVGVADEAGTRVVDAVQQGARAQDPAASVTAQTLGSDDAVVEAVRSGDVDYGLLRTDAGWELVDEGPTSADLEMLTRTAVTEQTLAANAAEAGTNVQALTEGSAVTTRDLTEQEDGSDGFMAFILGFVFAFLFYMASLMFGMQIASSVVEEKQSRLVEILAAAIPVRSLLVGKVLGSTVLALGQLVLICAVGLVGLTFTDLDVALPGLATGIAWYLPFFVAGFVALACVWAAAGALASRNEDLQATTMPLTMVLVLVFIVGLNLQGVWREILSFVPIFSTILMPMRILEGKADWWEPVLALVLVLGFCALTIWFGARLYQRALMHTSGSLTWRKALALRGE